MSLESAKNSVNEKVTNELGTTPQFPSGEDHAWLSETLKKANAGDSEALASLRRFLDANPDLVGEIGDHAAVARHALITTAANGNLLATEAAKRDLEARKARLLDGSTDEVLHMLCDVVLVNYIEFYLLLSHKADNSNGPSSKASGEIAKRLESAQRRYIESLQQLEQMRLLLLNSQQRRPALRIAKESLA